ncbi:MAG: DinB family protein [Planctomycetota bacterium]
MTETRLELVRGQIEFSRTYTLSLLADIHQRDWLRQPQEGITHVTWQIGHLAMAEYGLGLYCMRGRRAEDRSLMPSHFRKKFSKGSIPDPDPTNNPSPAETRDVLDRVHLQLLAELPGYTDQDLDQPADEPYALFPTKLGGLYFCAAHEMMHAGQIGLLRRLLGKANIR